MKAVVIDEFGGKEKMRVDEMPAPKPGKGEVQIESAYAGVNPADWKIREGILDKLVKTEFPAILGWDVSGWVSEVGEGVDDFKEGDEVYSYCRKEVVQWGAFAEYVCVSAEHVAKLPKNLSFPEAAGIPLVGLTAWQALFDVAKLSKGQSILIQGGAGGVGSLAIQLAKWAGARVYTTASLRNHQYASELGADKAFDYHEMDIGKLQEEVEPKGFDVVFDCVGGKVFDQCITMVKRGGWLITICKPFIEDAIGQKHGIRTSFVFVRPNGGQLAEISKLFDTGHLRAPHITEYPLEDAAEALEKNREGHTRGKIVLKIK